eukprot:Sspe_Gene.16232::Locus_5717_Transcript_1_1_Confidence_1.000_Length_2938::g.16232::m.16232
MRVPLPTYPHLRVHSYFLSALSLPPPSSLQNGCQPHTHTHIHTPTTGSEGPLREKGEGRECTGLGKGAILMLLHGERRSSVDQGTVWVGLPSLLVMCHLRIVAGRRYPLFSAVRSLRPPLPRLSLLPLLPLLLLFLSLPPSSSRSPPRHPYLPSAKGFKC